MIQLSEPCERRPVRFLELWEIADWRLKVYGIAYNRETPRPELIAAAKSLAERIIPSPAITSTRYGVGFLGIHDGRGANFIFLCWWSNENELHHRVFTSPSDEFQNMVEQTGDDARACVWDLAVIDFERVAWLECVLRNRSGPDLQAYLNRRLHAEV